MSCSAREGLRYISRQLNRSIRIFRQVWLGTLNVRMLSVITMRLLQYFYKRIMNPVSILHKSIAGRRRPVRVADGPITARCRCINNASWEGSFHIAKKFSRPKCFQCPHMSRSPILMAHVEVRSFFFNKILTKKKKKKKKHVHTHKSKHVTDTKMKSKWTGLSIARTHN